jgi:transposase
MEASSNDMKSLPPACSGCAARDRQIAELQAHIALLEARLAKLEVAARASKRQAAPFSKGLPKADPKPPGRKSGENYGTHHRRAVPSRIDEVLEAPLPLQCPFCSGVVIQKEVAQQYQTEAPRQSINRQFNVCVGECCTCHRRVQGRHPLQTSDALGAAAVQIGPDAQALAVQLNKEAGLSHGKVKRFFKAAFDIELSRSTSCRTVLRAARRCEPVYQVIARRVQQSPFIVPDETGWRIGGMLAWLHVAVGIDATAYLVHVQRGYEAMIELIGEDYEGFLTHDGWSPYMKFIYAIHQTCLAHLLRRAHEMEESAVGGAVHFPRQVKAILKDALAVRDQRDAGELTAQEAIEQAKILSRQMIELTCRPRENEENERFAKHVWNVQECLFTFLEFEGVDATNYKAEQAIRPATANRKVWGGNRTDTGAKAQSILMSVIRTAAQRGIEAVDFISSTLKACFGSRPSLFPDTG